jgi:hypothetical protein
MLRLTAASLSKVMGPGTAARRCRPFSTDHGGKWTFKDQVLVAAMVITTSVSFAATVHTCVFVNLRREKELLDMEQLLAELDLTVASIHQQRVQKEQHTTAQQRQR